MSQKLVSVIIPTYNRAHLVVEAIKSVQAQSYENIQLIVVDDGSVDQTAQRVAEFQEVEYYYQENKGQGAARNLGLSHAKGLYIASLDSDDIWNHDFVEVAVNALDKFKADFVFLNWTESAEEDQSLNSWERGKIGQKYFKKIKDEWVFLNPAEVRELFVQVCPAPSSAFLIRRDSMVSCWNEEMKIADDWYLFLEMVLTRRCEAAFTFNRHWTKRIHSTNIYHGREKLEILRDLGLHDGLLFAERFREQLTYLEKAVLKRRLATNYFNIGRINWKREGVSFKALQSIARSFTLAPMGNTLYVIKLTFNHLLYRFRTTRNKNKQLNDT